MKEDRAHEAEVSRRVSSGITCIGHANVLVAVPKHSPEILSAE